MLDNRVPATCAPENDAAIVEVALLGGQHWPAGLEALYERQRGPARRERMARATAIGGMIFLCFALLDSMAGAAVLAKGLPWRLGACVLAVCCAGWLRRMPAGPRVGRAELALNIVPLLVFMMVTQYIGEYGGRWADRYMMAAAVVVAGFIAITPVTRRTALWLCATAILAYPIVPWLLPYALPLRTNVDLVVFAAFMLAISVLVARRNENARRASFLFLRRHEISAAELNVMNAALLRLSATDPLTGLANRRAFNQALGTHWLDRRQSLGLAIFDVDWFKAFNDSAGHAAGDAALQAVASAAERAVRSGIDHAARIGGEEFAVLMPGLDQDQAHAMAERLRRTISTLALPHPGRPGRTLSVSVGVAWCTHADRRHHTQDAFMNRADMALYAAKAAGRDRVVLAEPLTWASVD